MTFREEFRRVRLAAIEQPKLNPEPLRTGRVAGVESLKLPAAGTCSHVMSGAVEDARLQPPCRRPKKFSVHAESDCDVRLLIDVRAEISCASHLA